MKNGRRSLHHAKLLDGADVVQLYVKSNQIFNCPSERFNLQDDPRQRFYTDYRYNANLSALSLEKINYFDSTILLSEGNGGEDNSNARYAGSTLTDAWRTDTNSPAFRHLDGANYAFTNGHVKWLAPKKISDKSLSGKNATFRIK